MMLRNLGRPWIGLWVLVVGVAIACSTLCAAAPQSLPKALEPALAAFESRDYQRAATLARVAADRSQGVEREGARYLEGLALFRAGSLESAANALRAAATSSDPFIASQANITLGSVEVERKQFDASGHAYRRAALLLTGDEAKRAHSYAARLFDEAGLDTLAELERVAAGEPRVLEAKPAPAPRPVPVVPKRDEPRRTVTARDKPTPPSTPPSIPPSTPAAIAPIRYSIQAGAFASAAAAKKCAEGLRTKCIALGVGAPRIVAQEEKGQTLHIVQIGSFSNKNEATRISSKLPKSAYLVKPCLGEGVAGHDAD
jgi:cell division septation protein DedD